MHKFNWSEVVTDNLLVTLSEITGSDLETERNKIIFLLTSILKSIGGLPIVDKSLNNDEKTILAKKILSEALDHYLFKVGIVNPVAGYFLTKSRNSKYEYAIVDTERININSADSDQLEKLPVIGKKNAEKIVKERNENGLFDSYEDLAKRVSGIGMKSKTILKYVICFDNPAIEVRTKLKKNADFETKLTTALSLSSENITKKTVIQLLDVIATTVATEPHAKSKEQQIREDFQLETVEMFSSSWVSILEHSDYFKHLPDIIRGAKHSIKVAMFHIALPKKTHPTKALLDELIGAKSRGLEVKVLLDQDRKSDPYKSTIINSNAKKYLESNGVLCKFDSEKVLLHSKYIIVDNDLCVLGSHNWSAGSYFSFDDLSFVVNSEIICQQLNERFEQLWSTSG